MSLGDLFVQPEGVKHAQKEVARSDHQHLWKDDECDQFFTHDQRSTKEEN